jgi:hypothetical protein
MSWVTRENNTAQFLYVQIAVDDHFFYLDRVQVSR